MARAVPPLSSLDLSGESLDLPPSRTWPGKSEASWSRVSKPGSRCRLSSERTFVPGSGHCEPGRGGSRKPTGTAGTERETPKMPCSGTSAECPARAAALSTTTFGFSASSGPVPLWPALYHPLVLSACPEFWSNLCFTFSWSYLVFLAGTAGDFNPRLHQVKTG